MNNLLPLLIFTPFAIGLILCVWGGKLGSGAAKIGLSGLLLTFALAIATVAVADRTASATDVGLIQPSLYFNYFDFKFPFRMLGHPVHWKLAFGLDGVGSLMVLLTTVVSTCVGLAAMKQITSRLPMYLGLVLITQSLLLGVFMAMDVLTFYMFFEAVLMP